MIIAGDTYFENVVGDLLLMIIGGLTCLLCTGFGIIDVWAGKQRKRGVALNFDRRCFAREIFMVGSFRQMIARSGLDFRVRPHPGPLPQERGRDERLGME